MELQEIIKLEVREIFEAVREPREEMFNAALAAGRSADSQDLWQAMIDALLSGAYTRSAANMPKPSDCLARL